MSRSYQLVADEDLRHYQQFQANYEVLPIGSRILADGRKEIHVHVRSRNSLRLCWLINAYECDDDAQAYALFTSDNAPKMMSLSQEIAVQEPFRYADVTNLVFQAGFIPESASELFRVHIAVRLMSCEISESTESSMPNSHGRGYIWGFSITPRSDSGSDGEPFHVSCAYWDYVLLCVASEELPNDRHMLCTLVPSEDFQRSFVTAMQRFMARYGSGVAQPSDADDNRGKRMRVDNTLND